MVFTNPPVICGHRGSGRGVVEGLRENTVESFLAAVDEGLTWVEVDARVNADRLLVSRHDPRVEDGRFVSELGTRETDELGLMRLDDLFERLPPGVGVDLEVKTSLEDALRPRAETTAGLAADLVRRVGGGRPLVVSSFDASVPVIVRELLPEVDVGLITWRGYPLHMGIAAAVHLGVQLLAVPAVSFGLGQAAAQRMDRSPGDLVSAAHAAGLEVMVWSATADEEDELIAAGIDCLVVDDVPGALARHRARAGR
jgi:glycerophosphoryl diester phosphodiesterase